MDELAFNRKIQPLGMAILRALVIRRDCAKVWQSGEDEIVLNPLEAIALRDWLTLALQPDSAPDGTSKT